MGNLAAKRDWGFAPEYVESMWRILQAKNPGDFVVGTGEAHSVQEFVDEAFAYVGLDPQKHVVIDPKYFRPTEVEVLISDTAKAKKVLDWEPKVKFKELVRIMVDADMTSFGLKPLGDSEKILSSKFPNRWWGAN